VAAGSFKNWFEVDDGLAVDSIRPERENSQLDVLLKTLEKCRSSVAFELAVVHVKLFYVLIKVVLENAADL
jgi:hypothetical protein